MIVLEESKSLGAQPIEVGDDLDEVVLDVVRRAVAGRGRRVQLKEKLADVSERRSVVTEEQVAYEWPLGTLDVDLYNIDDPLQGSRRM